MKNLFCIKRSGIVLILLSFFINSFAQNSTSSELVNTWYEWPHEGTNGNTVFKIIKYIPVPGIDRQEEPFQKLEIKNDGTLVKTQYCGYCPNAVLTSNAGNYQTISQVNTISDITISFPNGDLSISAKVISYSNDKLVLNFQPAIKTN